MRLSNIEDPSIIAASSPAHAWLSFVSGIDRFVSEVECFYVGDLGECEILERRELTTVRRTEDEMFHTFLSLSFSHQGRGISE